MFFYTPNPILYFIEYFYKNIHEKQNELKHML